MAITYGYFDSINGDRKYNADQMSEYFDGIVSDGVFQSVGGALAVSAQSTPDMSVKVASGRAIINNKWIKNDADITLPITAASTAYARITSVVVQLDPANRLIRITTKDGTPSGSPVAPEITENELEIARITVAANATSIAGSAITDKREYVHGVINQVDWGGIGGNIANQSDLQNSLGLINARIDNIIELTPGSTTGDAELADIRVGADGTTYSTAGDAVRNQVEKLANNFYTEYNSGNNYSAGDCCTYKLKAYICKSATTGAWDSSKWEETKPLPKDITRLEEAETFDYESYLPEAKAGTGTKKVKGSTLLAELIDIRQGADGVTYPNAGDAVRAQTVQIINSLPFYYSNVTFNRYDNKRYDYYNNFEIKDASGYFACEFSAEASKTYKIRARNIGTNTTFGIAFFNNTTLLSSIIDYPSTENHTAEITTPQNCNIVKFSTNSNTNPWIKVTKKTVGTMEAVYVATNGADDHTGEESDPFQTIQAAIDSGLSDNIIVKGGIYKKGFSGSNKKNFSIIGDLATPVIIDLSKTITTESDSQTGLKRGAFQSVSSDLIYQVFVSQTKPISDSSGNVTAYTVNLWDYDGTTLLIPKLTITEVQNTSNTWTYDGTYIYINSSFNNYKLIDSNTSEAGMLTNIDNLLIENITFSYSGYNNCKVTNCNNANIKNCQFLRSGVQHGLAFSNSNAIIEKCVAKQNCFDGFSIHEKGNTTFIDCLSSYNRDDGMSHHDGATGTVIGGKYDHNGKGGISPTYDAVVNIYNAFCSNNSYGIYYAASTSLIECIINGCVLVNNNGYGLRVNGYGICSFNTVFSGNNQNQKVDGDGYIYEL